MKALFRIIRYHKNDDRRIVIKEGLSLQEAQAHCRDPKTRCPDGKWFDGFTKVEPLHGFDINGNPERDFKRSLMILQKELTEKSFDNTLHRHEEKYVQRRHKGDK